MKFPAYKLDEIINNSITNYKSALIYGPDKGLASERAANITKKILGEEKDPFLYSEITNKAVLDNNSLLADEYNALSMIGGTKLIKIADAENGLAKIIEEAVVNSSSENFLLIIAEDLAPASKLRQLYEKSDFLAAIPCYVDDQKTLINIVRDFLNQNGFRFSYQLPSMISSQFHGDRMILRSELNKLATYKGEDKDLSEDDVLNIISGIKEDDYQEFANKVAGLDSKAAIKEIENNIASGIYPVTLVRVLINYFFRLVRVKSKIEKGSNFDEAIKELRPPVFFKQKDLMKIHLNSWNIKQLNQALKKLEECEITLKSSTILPADIVLKDFTTKLIFNVKASNENFRRQAA